MAKKTKKLHPGGLAQNDFMAGVRRQQRGQKLKQNPTMPTAGISQGRPVTGRAPMPGPAPNAEEMKRMQKLMREQQERFNQMQKARIEATNRRKAQLKQIGNKSGSQILKSLPNLGDFYMDKKTGQSYYLPNGKK